MIEVITAPERTFDEENKTLIFLGGGIQQCPEWQKEIIERFNQTEEILKPCIIFNPRRPNFPINDPSSSLEQITWEFDMLEKCDLFTMLFCKSNSDQPICFYELGRNIETMKKKYPLTWKDRIIISVDEKFKRKEDVVIQTRLATGEKIKVNIQPTEKLIETHFNEVTSFLKSSN